MRGTHGLAARSEEPDRLNRKNGWEQREFFKWVSNQGGDAPRDFQKRGMEKMGGEYIHPLKRLSINSFADLKVYVTLARRQFRSKQFLFTKAYVITLPC